jgi:hypothetical protein
MKPYVYYKESDCKTYMEGYLLKKYLRKKQELDLSIFESEDIQIENTQDSLDNIIQLALLRKPDFIFDKQYLKEIEKHIWYKSTHGIQAKVSNKTTRLAKFIIELATNKNKVIKNGTEVTFKTNDYYDYRTNNLIFIDRSKARQLRETKNSSGYRGVVQYGNLYRVFCNRISLGYYGTPEEAAEPTTKKLVSYTENLHIKTKYQNKGGLNNGC